MGYQKPDVECVTSIVVYACRHSTCNGQSRVILENEESPVHCNEQESAYAKAS